MLMLLAALVTSPAQGPVLGDLKPSSVQIWMRLDQPGEALVNLYDPSGTLAWHTLVEASADTDNTVVATLRSPRTTCLAGLALTAPPRLST